MSARHGSGGVMAHDRQLEPEGEMIPLPSELQERKKESPKLTDKQSASLGVLADWWAVYGQIYRDDPTEILAVSFREILKPLLDFPEVLHEACLIAARESSEFRPKPGRIYEIAEGLLMCRQNNRPKYLDEPKLTEAEREAELASPEYQELRRKVTGA